MTKLSNEQREALDEELKTLGAAEEKITAARKPYDEALAQIWNARDLVLQRYGVNEPLGECITCDTLLFEGDLGHECADGEKMCAEHAPTWGDFKRQVEDSHDEEDEGGISNTDKLSSVNAHLAAGGKLTDRIVHTL